MWGSGLFRLVVLSSILVIGFPAGAMAGWPLAGSGSQTVLGFGERYSAADGGSSTHHGLDIQGVPGESVVAPLGGTVSFIGRVPGANGSTVLAATLQTVSGAVTMLPLTGAAVARGEEVAPGDVIALLAESGDGSWATTHLHVGLRKDGLYLDPADILVAPAGPSTQPEPEPAEVMPEPTAVPEVTAAPEMGGGSAEGAGAGVGKAIGSGAGANARAGVEVGANAVASSATRAGVTANPRTRAVSAAAGAVPANAAAGAELAPGVSLAAAAGPPTVVAAGAQGVVAETGRALAAGQVIARSTSEAVANGRLTAVVRRVMGLARSGAKTMTLVAVAVLCALGALWPLWRAAERGEGLGKVPVSAITDDVAAVASR